MRAYLSIDLDYWCKFTTPHSARAFFQRVWKLRLPIMVALHHHHLLDDINKRAQDLDTVINVDFHSDIADDIRDTAMELNEGTWANFVHFRGDGTFIWRYPEEECLDDRHGYCHEGVNPFDEPSVAGWKRARKMQGLARMPWKSIEAVGVCLSPYWLNQGKWAVVYPLAALELFDWLGRWTVYDGCNASDCPDAEKGEGVYTPHLTFPRLVV